jgi:outer membrane protein TolC
VKGGESSVVWKNYHPGQKSIIVVNMRRVLIGLFLATASCFAWNLSDVSKIVLDRNPRLSEDSVELEQARNNYDKVKYGAILPRFELGVAYGPAPGFRYDTATNPLTHTVDSVRKYSWWPLGPYFGSQISVAQPLNVQQLRSGLKAARGGIAVEQHKLFGKRQGYLKEAAEYYLGYVFARTMIDLLEPALAKLNKADSTLQAQLDNDEEGASQTELLQLRCNRLTADKGLEDARTGLERADKGLRFVMGLRPEEPLLIEEKELFQFADLGSWDSVRGTMDPSELRQLRSGIEARSAMVDLQKALMGPTIAIFADLSYTKAWVANRNDANNDVLITDPINSLSGKIGLGFSWQLNFWSRSRNYISAQLDLEALRRKEAYAKPGLEAQLAESFVRYQSLGRKLVFTEKARNAADSWLKAVALQVDADSTRERDLIAPYQRFLDLQHEYFDVVYQRDMVTLEILQKSGHLTPEALTLRKP